VPLPQSSAFATTGQPSQTGAQIWIYTVPNTDAQHIEAFYRTALPPQGWAESHEDFTMATGGQSVSITAQKIGRALSITAGPGPVGSVTVRAGGVVLQLTMSLTGV
jgi:hypothetical protein